MKDELTEICRRYILTTEHNVVVHEPYLPFLPTNWNRILVLAEAQNLGSSSAGYVEELKNGSVEDRIHRLANADPSNVGVQPWDDGSLKLAIDAAMGAQVKVEDTAISNAVLWSQVDDRRNNANPSQDIVALSASLWSEMLSVLRPEQVITAGKVAEGVITQVAGEDPTWRHIKLRLPSRTAMSRVSGMFQDHDLLHRYPEVARAIDRHPEWVGKSYRQNKVFFACHAVSMTRAKEAPVATG